MINVKATYLYSWYHSNIWRKIDYLYYYNVILQNFNEYHLGNQSVLSEYCFLLSVSVFCTITITTGRTGKCGF